MTDPVWIAFWWCLNWADISCQPMDGKTGNITFYSEEQCKGFGSFGVHWYGMKPMRLPLAYTCAEMIERFVQAERPVHLKK